jgi:hypothetical protein
VEPLVFQCAGAIAVALGLPGLVLSPFTAPRGDNDGLWTLIVPAMAFLTFVLVVLALGAAAVRVRVSGASPTAGGLGRSGRIGQSIGLIVVDQPSPPIMTRWSQRLDMSVTWI